MRTKRPKDHILFGNIRQLVIKRWRAALGLAVVALGLWSCVPEKALDPDSAIIPMVWLDESRILVAHDQALFLRDQDGTETRVYGPDARLEPQNLADACVWKDRVALLPPPLQFLKSGMILSFSLAPLREGQMALSVVEEKMAHNALLNPADCTPGAAFQAAALDGQPGPPNVQKVTLHDFHPWPAGLATVFPAEVADEALIAFTARTATLKLRKLDIWRVVDLPKVTGAYSMPLIYRDDVSGKYLLIQTPGYAGAPEAFRQGWWLDEEATQATPFKLPGKNLARPSWDDRCFSCGCSCYIVTDHYAVGGEVYMHIRGWPLPDSQRGLYRLRADPSKPDWERLVPGRLSAPLAFSPSGCKVASYTVSYFGNALSVFDLCSKPEG